MKILMVYPKCPDTFWSYKDALRFIRKKAITPPLGLLTIAAMLPDDWDITLADMNVRPLEDHMIRDADYVWISAMSIQQKSTDDVIRRCLDFETPIVAGGPLFSTGWQDYPDIDHIICGEGETAVAEFLSDLKKGAAGKLYPAGAWGDMRVSPAPKWDLVRMKDYASMSIQYSRGCPYACDFCDITLLFGRKVRTKTTKQIIDELDLIYASGWRDSVFFVDDNFIISKHQLKEDLLPELISWMEERNYPFIFNTQASINISDDEQLMQLMAKAGFNKIFVGIESPNEASLGECSKNHNLNRSLIDSVKKIHQSGLEVQGGFIVGFDSDPRTIFDDQIAFIQNSSIITAMVGLLSALKGTELYHKLKDENRLVKEGSGDNTDCSINFLPRMEKEYLLEGYKRLVSTIYSPACYYARVKEFLKTYRPIQFPRHDLFKPAYLLALIKSTFLIGIAGRERAQYWKLIFWTMFRRPKFVPLAVTYAIYGYHYRRTADRVVKNHTAD